MTRDQPNSTIRTAGVQGVTSGMALAEAIEAVRAELEEAKRNAAGKDLAFEFGDVELEFTVTMTHEAKLNGGVKVWVLDLGASEGTSSGTTHKLKFVLKPKDSVTDAPWRVSDREETPPPRH
jgi:hypothetical protein